MVITPELLEAIDAIGFARSQIKKLKETDDKYSKEVKEKLGAGEVVTTESFRAELVVQNNRVLDQEKLRKKIGQKKYFELAKITIEDLKNVLGAEEIDECTTSFKEVRKLNVNPLSEPMKSVQ
jgi:FtsZ-binding cell division protein ZapB